MIRLACTLRAQAEWIVDLTTRADRDGKHAEYADRYDGSELKRTNLKELDLQLDRGFRVSAEQLRELGARSETTNPWYWGVRTLIKVRHVLCFGPSSHAGPAQLACLHSPMHGQPTCLLTGLLTLS